MQMNGKEIVEYIKNLDNDDDLLFELNVVIQSKINNYTVDKLSNKLKMHLSNAKDNFIEKIINDLKVNKYKYIKNDYKVSSYIKIETTYFVMDHEYDNSYNDNIDVFLNGELLLTYYDMDDLLRECVMDEMNDSGLLESLEIEVDAKTFANFIYNVIDFLTSDSKNILEYIEI